MHRGECWERRGIYLPGTMFQLTHKRILFSNYLANLALDESVRVDESIDGQLMHMYMKSQSGFASIF